jgi:hypothetical protein
LLLLHVCCISLAATTPTPPTPTPPTPIARSCGYKDGWVRDDACRRFCQRRAAQTVSSATNATEALQRMRGVVCHRCPASVQLHSPTASDATFEYIRAQQHKLTKEAMSTNGRGDGSGGGVGGDAFHWGNVLDAGTGAGSLRFVSSLRTSSWTAVTASQSMATRAEQAAATPRSSVFSAFTGGGGGGGAHENAVIVGLWSDEELLRNVTFDVVIADYLIGAVDGFAPHTSSRLFPRLHRHLRQSCSGHQAQAARLYVIGCTSCTCVLLTRLLFRLLFFLARTGIS